MKTLLLVLVLALPVVAEAPAAPTALDATRLIAASLEAFHAAGADFSADVSMRIIDAQNRERTRRLTLLRRDEAAGRQWYYLYFHEPADVRGMSFLVRKYPDRDDDRWLFLPAADLVRRVAARDARSSFAGSDFSYEDVSGRDVGTDRHRVLGDTTVNGRRCVQVESIPGGAAEYARKISVIDAANHLPLMELYYDAQGRLIRRFTINEVKTIGSNPTATIQTMEDLRRGNRTVVRFTNVRYDRGMPAEIFAERSLRATPRTWF